MSGSTSLSLARLAPILTPLSAVAMLAAAIGWGVGSLASHQALAFIMALAPCVLVNALPVIPIFTLQSLHRRDIHVRDMGVLDRIAETDTLVVDGAAMLFAPARLANPTQIGSRNMQIAASLGARSDDPLAKALFGIYGGKILGFENLQTNALGTKAVFEGKAVSLSRYAANSSDLWLDVTGCPCVRFIFSIEPKPEAQAVLASFKDANKRIVLVTDEASEFSVARLGIDEIRKTSKQELLKDLNTRGAKVLWFGLNKDDLPLAPSDVFLSAADDTAADAILPAASLKPLGFLLSTTTIYERILARHVFIALMATGLLLALALLNALSVQSGLSALAAFVIGLYLSARQALQKGHPSVTA